VTAFADVAEGVRDPLAAYAHALDDGRPADVVATFCADGSIDVPGMGSYQGTDALLDANTRFNRRRPQRHLVVNTHVLEWSDEEATVESDVVFLLLGKDDAWSVRLVGRYHDVLHRDADTWRFHSRTATFEGMA
jgi:3-phenylpropionate/cinnamic acid dioxygenase small subunit